MGVACSPISTFAETVLQRRRPFYPEGCLAGASQAHSTGEGRRDSWVGGLSCNAAGRNAAGLGGCTDLIGTKTQKPLQNSARDRTRASDDDTRVLRVPETDNVFVLQRAV